MKDIKLAIWTLMQYRLAIKTKRIYHEICLTQQGI